jgi:hypothetical protein
LDFAWGGVYQKGLQDDNEGVGVTYSRGRGVTVAVKVLPIHPREIDARLLAFEEKFNMPSSRFTEAFRNGRLQETPEFHEWAQLVAAKELVDLSRR